MVRKIITLLFIILLVNIGYSQTKKWRDNKFSMFIHFGLYSELGGVWNGEKIEKGYSEQIQSHGGIFSNWYAGVADKFNPVKWDSDKVVDLAIEAGMKSIVFTSKHHDGFCMYDSKHTDFNIVDATPYHKDIMYDLSQACHKKGIGFGVYFSLIDWHFPQAYPISSHNADFITAEHHQYNLKQVREIMTNYGEISEIWFDMGALSPSQSKELYALVKSLQPNCMISGRLGNDMGDFCVMGDNEYPNYKIGQAWQTAASFFDETWGYRSWQKRGSVEGKFNEKINSLVNVVSRGGNYLLNIGPKGDGSVVEFEKNVLNKMGEWLHKYGEAIYGCEANPLDHNLDWGNITCKGNNLYVFINDVEQKVLIPNIYGHIKSVSSLNTGNTVDYKENKKGIYLSTDSKKENKILKIEFLNGFDIKHNVSSKSLFTSYNSTPVYSYSSMDYYTGFRSIIAYQWMFKTNKKRINPYLYYTDNEKGRVIRFSIDDRYKDIKLEGGRKLKNATYKGLDFGKVFISSPIVSSFGNSKFTDIPSVDSLYNYCEFTPQQDFKYGNKYSRKAGDREFFYIQQKITSRRSQNLFVEVGGGNGIQVILNGKTLLMRTTERGQEYSKEVVELPLKKGNNELLIKIYNRYEKNICYSYNPFITNNTYRLDAGTFELNRNKYHRINLKAKDTATKNSEIRLGNLKIYL